MPANNEYIEKILERGGLYRQAILDLAHLLSTENDDSEVISTADAIERIAEANVEELRSKAKKLLNSMKGKSAEDKDIALNNFMKINTKRFMAEKIIGLAQEAKAIVSRKGVITTSTSISNMIAYAREYERAYRLQSTSTPDDWIMEAIAAEEAAAAEAQEAEAYALVRAEIALMEDAAKARAVVEKQIEDDAARAAAAADAAAAVAEVDAFLKEQQIDEDEKLAWRVYEKLNGTKSQGGKSRKQKSRKQKSRKQKSRKQKSRKQKSRKQKSRK
jgi:hypothetical protein